MNKISYRHITLITAALLALPAGCGSRFMFTYSDKSYENYLEDQRGKTPWEADAAATQLRGYHKSETLPSKTLKGMVKEVISLDTIRLKNGQYVKYIGVDGPESGDEDFDNAREFNLMLVGKREVTLQFDTFGRETDGALLAYVFVDGIFVNGEIIRHGFARFTPNEKNTKYQKMLTAYEADAVSKKKGVWADND